MVLDTMDVNRLQSYKDYFDGVRKGLLLEILDQSFIEKNTLVLRNKNINMSIVIEVL